MNISNNLRMLIRLSVLSTIALTIFMIELQIPPLVPIPGVKIGLANIITLIILALYGTREAALVLFIRVFLGSMFSGQVVTFFYSLSGGILCLITMATFMKLLGKRSICFVSVGGAISHNIGQIVIAMIILKTTSILYYLPILLISAIITGIFIGILSKFMIHNGVLNKLINDSLVNN